MRLRASLLIVAFGLATPDTLAAQHASNPARWFRTSDVCLSCHNTLVTPSGTDVSIGSDWRASMMANSARDPYWQASVRRELIDHPSAREEIEDTCSTCHMPMTRFAAKTANRSGEIFRHLPGFDASDSLVQAMRNGHIDGLVVQDPVRMGYLGVKTMVSHLKGEKVERRIDTGVRVIAKADMDTPEAKELLKPDLDKWLKKP